MHPSAFGVAALMILHDRVRLVATKMTRNARRAVQNWPMLYEGSSYWHVFERLFSQTNIMWRKFQRSDPLQFEALERRDVPSVTSLSLSGMNLVIHTDDANTAVTVRPIGPDIQIEEGNWSNQTWKYAASSVGSIEFNGGAGNDRFESQVDLLLVRAFGGAGNDTLIGNAGNDLLDGEDGSDVLLGMSGDDILTGGPGDDQLNGGEGIDSLWGGDGNDVLVAIDGSAGDQIQSDAGADILWVDRKEWPDDLTQADRANYVGSFANGADRTLDGDRIADPVSINGVSYRQFKDRPLFSSLGPSTTDIEQGSVGDCWLLAGLGAIARDRPDAIRERVVDFNDGTYGVHLGNKFYRVDNDLPARLTSGNYVLQPDPVPVGAGLGAEGSMWVAVLEKAYAHYRGGNSYSSLWGGWAVAVNRAFRTRSAGDRAFSDYGSAAILANEIHNRWSTQQAVTVGVIGKKATSSYVPLLMPHMYSVYSVERNETDGVTAIVLRNPWGYDGAGADANTQDGLVQVTPTQLYDLIGRVNWGRV
jgi:Ca2+-binding RTX toxin-like protein